MKSLFEYFLLFNSYPIEDAKKKLLHLNSLPSTSLQSFQNKEIWSIFDFHFHNNPYYNSILDNTYPSSWEEIPVLKKSDFQKNLKDLISDPFKGKKLYKSNTSGSSGHPFFFAKDKFSHAVTWVKILNLYSQYDINFSSKQARFYGIPLDNGGYLKEKLKDLILNRKRFVVFDLSDSKMEQWLNKFKIFSFEYLYGYTSSLVYFAKYCIQKNIVLRDICKTLKVCIVTSEVCTPEDKVILNLGFGIQIVNEYGASEVGVIAFENPKGYWEICEDSVYVEIVDENNLQLDYGVEGRILCTSFNEAMPFIRYEIGDIGSLSSIDGKKCLEALSGRVNDYIKLPSGKVSPGLTFYYISKSLLEESGIIKEFIIKQTEIDTFIFVVNSSRTLNKIEINSLQAKADIFLEPGLKIKIQYVDTIDRPNSGKIKHFYSYI